MKGNGMVWRRYKVAIKEIGLDPSVVECLKEQEKRPQPPQKGQKKKKPAAFKAALALRA